MHQVKEKSSLVASHNQQESPFPMTTITQLQPIIQTLLTSTADEMAKKLVLFSDNGK
jgi:hypothetical protein